MKSEPKDLPIPAQGIALIGCGAWGVNLARNFTKLAALKVIVDKDSSRLDEIKKTFPQVETQTNIDAVLQREDIHGVVIATPSTTHAELGLRALKAGKHTFIEKPMALRARDGEKLVKTARQHRRILMVGHVLEYHPAILKLRELISQGVLGKIYYIYSNRLNLGRIRTEENALWSFAPHDVAILLRLLGKKPETVSCTGSAHLNTSVADTTLTHLSFSDGVRAHIFVSWLHPFKEHKLVVIGSLRMAVFDDLPSWDQKLILQPHKIDWVDGTTPVARRAEAIPVKLDPVEPLYSECREFLECIKTGAKPLTDGPSGVAVLEILEEAQNCLDQSQRPLDGETTSPYFAHPTSTIGPSCEIGKNTRIWHYSHIMSGAKIGENCVLGQNTFVARNAVIGDGVKIQNNVSVYEGVILENHVFCGPSVVFTNILNPRSQISRKSEFHRTLVKEGATLGANSTIVCGVTVGRFSFVAAGAVVTSEVPDFALVVGVPARIAGWRCFCGEALDFQSDGARCKRCQKTFKQLSSTQIEETS